ncbi:hypothetical protein F5884DRAFT_527082 [Xylogone sp. PMI_703]|nr:hypothetical protein F5884DRAFT_527082 [Xylogone sp. PMI_703]
MVGVPGRSKACHTCRQRRIACGLERPQCSQCVKSNRVCAGYQRERVFVLNHESTEQALKSYAQAQIQILGGQLRHGPGRGKKKNASVKTDERAAAHTRTKTPPWEPQLLAHLAPRAVYRQQLLNEFLCSQVPANYRRSDPDDRMTPWFMLLADQPVLTKALECSMLAVCTSRLGRVHNDTALVNESLKLYGLGLRELQKALWDPKLMYNDETLAACMALTTYEVLECPEGTYHGLLTHHNGLERLVQLRGAEAHSSGLGHKVFIIFRTTSILHSMEKKCISYLAEPEWSEIPFKKIPKEPYDHLIDILGQGTGILAETAYFDHLCPGHLLQMTLNLIERCWKLDFQLQKFIERQKQGSSGPLYWPRSPQYTVLSEEVKEENLFPVSFCFDNLIVANTCVVYWAICLILWSGMLALYTVIYQLYQQGIDMAFLDPSVHPNPHCPICTHTIAPPSNSSLPYVETIDPSQLPPLLHRADLLATARNICQSVEYFMQEEMLVQGPALIVMPLTVVIETAKEYPTFAKEVEWARNVLGKIEERGVRIIKGVKKHLSESKK